MPLLNKFLYKYFIREKKLELGIDKLFQMLTSNEKKEKKERRELMLNSEGMSGKDGNGAGWGRRMGFSSLSRMILSCPILALHDGKKFLTPSLSLSAL